MVALATLVLISLVQFAQKQHNERLLKDLKIVIDTSAGNFFVNDKTVGQLIFSTNGYIKQRRLGEIRVGEMEKELNNHPFIRKAKVFLSIDGTLHASIYQQEPILRIKDRLKIYYLTKEGQSIPLHPAYAAKVILAEGLFSKEDQKALLTLVSYINADKLLKKQIIGIQKTAPDSFKLIPRIGRHTIAFGALTDFDTKFEKLKVFYRQYLNKMHSEQYKIINLQYKNQVVATKK